MDQAIPLRESTTSNISEAAVFNDLIYSVFLALDSTSFRGGGTRPFPSFRSEKGPQYKGSKDSRKATSQQGNVTVTMASREQDKMRGRRASRGHGPTQFGTSFSSLVLYAFFLRRPYPDAPETSFPFFGPPATINFFLPDRSQS